jgi:hypothetical protein
MKRLIQFLLIVWLMASTAFGAIDCAIHTQKGSTNGTGVVTDPITTTGGSAVYANVSDFQSDGYTLTDATMACMSPCNTYTGLTAQSNTADGRSRIWYNENPTVGAGHVFTVTCTTSCYPVISVLVCTGTRTSSSFDQENGSNASGATVTTIQPGSVTPSENNEVVIAGLSYTGTTVATVDSGFNQLDATAPLDAGNAFGGGIAFKVQTTAAGVNPTWTWMDGTKAAATVATFKQPSTATPLRGNLLLLGVGR